MAALCILGNHVVYRESWNHNTRHVTYSYYGGLIVFGRTIELRIRSEVKITIFVRVYTATHIHQSFHQFILTYIYTEREREREEREREERERERESIALLLKYLHMGQTRYFISKHIH